MAGATASSKRKKTNKPGVVRNDEVLTLPEFKERMGMQDWAWRKACHKARSLGIELCTYQGNHGYVSGQVWHAYLIRKSGVNLNPENSQISAITVEWIEEWLKQQEGTAETAGEAGE